jgi:hypothetical protein
MTKRTYPLGRMSHHRGALLVSIEFTWQARLAEIR